MRKILTLTLGLFVLGIAPSYATEFNDEPEEVVVEERTVDVPARGCERTTVEHIDSDGSRVTKIEEVCD